MTRNVQSGRATRIAHHLSALAATNSARPAHASRRRRAARRADASAFGDHREKRGRDTRSASRRTRRPAARCRRARAGRARCAPRAAPRRSIGTNTSASSAIACQATARRLRRTSIAACRARAGARRAPQRCAARRRAGEADQRAQRAVEPPLRRELARRRARQPLRARRPAVLERLERRLGGELAAAHREPQAVAGHRIDEAGRVAGEQQPVDGARRRRRPPADRARRARRRARAGKPLAQHRIARQLADAAPRADRRAPASPGCQGFTRQTFVRPPGTGATPM